MAWQSQLGSLVVARAWWIPAAAGQQSWRGAVSLW